MYFSDGFFFFSSMSTTNKTPFNSDVHRVAAESQNYTARYHQGHEPDFNSESIRFTKQHNALMAHDADLSNCLQAAYCGSRLDISHLCQGQYPKWDQVPYSVTVSCLIIVAPLHNDTLARWRGPAQWPKLQLLRADQCKKMLCGWWIQCN